MAWNDTQVTLLNDGVTSWYFAPTELVFEGRYDFEKNQAVQTAEGGQVKILDLSDDEVRFFRFTINRMPLTDRSLGGLSIRGVDALEGLIRTTLNYRANTIDLWWPGTPKSPGFATTVRFWSSNFRIGRSPNYRSSSPYFGTGREELIFREEIT